MMKKKKEGMRFRGVSQKMENEEASNFTDEPKVAYFYTPPFLHRCKSLLDRIPRETGWCFLSTAAWTRLDFPWGLALDLGESV